MLYILNLQFKSKALDEEETRTNKKIKKKRQ